MIINSNSFSQKSQLLVAKHSLIFQVMAPNKRRKQVVDDGDDEDYLIGVQKALDYAFGVTEELYEMRCPCVKCCYTTLGTRETIESHLKVYGIIQNYTLGVSGNDSPGATGNGQGRGQGVRSMCSLGVSGNEVGSFHQNSLYSGQGMPAPCNSTSSDATISDYSGPSIPSNSNGTRSDPTISTGQGMQRTNRKPLVHDKEQMQIDIPSSPSTDQVMQYTQTVDTSSCTTRKVKRVRGRNKCKEVASLQAGEKLKVTFYNNRTVGKNSSIFSRHLGKLVRDQSMCPLGVSSWDDIEEEKLNHMWAAVEDKFESDDMDTHRDHILGWMKELWNKWRGQLHGKYVKGKPIQEALKNIPKGVDKKQWEWLVKEHFSTETFQARSNRNAANRAKLKMFHRIGSKPIREVIYQKGGKHGNPPDLATVFFETRKKDNKLVESEAIEKHAQIQELVQSEPSLPSIEIVEKCFGPQIRSHVFGFGGGVKAKDLKGAPSSKAELLSELRSTREENQSLIDRLSALENEVGSFHRNSFHSGQSIPTPSKSTSSDSAISAYSGQSVPSHSNGTRSDPTISAGQEMQRTSENPSVHEEEQMQIDITSPPSTDQVLQYTQTAEISSCTTRKVRRVRGRNKCKEVASLQAGEKLKVTFYNNRTVGKNSSIFSRHLGKLVRDQSMCPLGVSSWDDIEEEKLNHMWAAVEDKFESDDTDTHRDHILGWMKELWNKWRGQLHGKYVKGKPIQEALKNIPEGIDKKQWEWLVKEHFSTETFQARSNRNAANRAKLKMFHRIGSKPIREVIYQKGGKHGNPPDLATVFFETRKKDNKLVESEAIEKHAQIQELVQSEPSLPSIEIVEKCFGPQIRSHVFGFGGGVKAKDLKGAPPSKTELLSELHSTRKENQSLMDRLSAVENEKDSTGGASSKTELLSELHSTREENQSLMDRLSAVENEMKELKQLKELFLARYSNVQPPTLPISGE
ncbi:uncharacterized protein LOC132059799 [Lycium ferocissimum]|uniref:uncharacterized protein LOC132059799 n=1 Tax=Lycium ferocissimum TaxID=112874 RepID=UPI002815EDA3|nr:uncharacterized protein LOC132059799 [Lycium ferocissimum]